MVDPLRQAIPRRVVLKVDILSEVRQPQVKRPAVLRLAAATAVELVDRPSAVTREITLKETEPAAMVAWLLVVPQMPATAETAARPVQVATQQPEMPAAALVAIPMLKLRSSMAE